MPVPRNTITAPRSLMAPDTPSVRARGVEEAAGFAAAAGRMRAASSRMTASVADSIDAQRRNRETRARIDQAQWGVLGQLSDVAFRAASIERRVGERRAAEQADEVLSGFKDYLNKRVYGHTDPETGEWTPGTLEAPYRPKGPGNDKPTGPSIETSRAIGEWMDDKDGPMAHMDPDARAILERKLPDLLNPLMAQAEMATAKAMVARRQAADQNANAQDAALLSSAAADPNPVAWADMLGRLAPAMALRNTRGGLLNPSAASPQEARWKTPEDEALFAAAEREAVVQATLARARVQLAAAEADPDDAAANARLASLVAFAEWSPQQGGDPVLSQEQRAEVTLRAKQVEAARARRAAAAESAATQEAVAEMTALRLGHKTDRARLDELMPTLPTGVRVQIEREAERQVFAEDMYAYENAVDEINVGLFNGSITQADARLRLDKQIAGMRSDRARNKALLSLSPDGQGAAPTKAAAEARKDFVAARELAVAYQGTLDANGSFVKHPDAALLSMIDADLDAGRITGREHERMRGVIAKRAMEGASEAVLAALSRRVDAKDLAAAFAETGGRFALRSGTDPAKTLAKADVRYVKGYGEDDDQNKFKRTGARTATVRLSGEVALEVANLALRFEELRRLGKTPQGMTLDEYIDRSLTPTAMVALRDYDEAKLRENIAIRGSAFLREIEEAMVERTLNAQLPRTRED